MTRLCKNCARLNIADLCPFPPDYHDAWQIKYDFRDPNLSDPPSALIAKDSLALMKSADRGCSFCGFVWQTVSRFRKHAKLAERIYEPVRLSMDWRAGWSIERSGSHSNDPTPIIDWPTLLISPWDVPIIDHSRWDEVKHKTQRPLSIDPCSPEVIALASSWIAQCLSKHSSCCSRQTSQLPPRLIDLASELPDTKLRVINTDQFNVKGDLTPVQYFALSYSWGPYTEHNTVRDNYRARLHQFEASTLPRTISDAVRVCRLLRCRYLWVDSICMVQDDDEDKGKNLALMQYIYKNASCTISAMDARSSHGGMLQEHTWAKYHGYTANIPMLPKPRSSRMYSGLRRSSESKKTTSEIESFIPRDCHDAVAKYSPQEDRFRFQSAIDNSFLETRGWTFQERLLSPRRLCFGASGLYWECHEFSASEMWPEGFNRIGQSRTEMNYLYHDSRYHLSPQPGEDWRQLMKSASLRNLTRPSDKLDSLAGVAREYQERKGKQEDKYIAGLWLSSIIYDLAWTGEGHGVFEWRLDGSPTPEWNIEQPTWSWAAQSRRDIQWPSWSQWDPPKGQIVEEANLIRHCITPERPGNALGNVQTGGYLVIKSQIGLYSVAEAHLELAWTLDTIIGIDGRPRQFCLDRPLPANWMSSLHFFVLLSAGPNDGETAISASGPPPVMAWALLLVPANGQDNSWRRVGFCQTKFPQDFAHGTVETIKLL